jgi:hypothetical protein
MGTVEKVGVPLHAVVVGIAEPGYAILMKTSAV